MSARWMNLPSSATKGQSEYLKKKNAWREGMSKTEAAVEIRKIVALSNKKRRVMGLEEITPKQRYVLVSHGIEPRNMSKCQAMQAISKIKQNEGINQMHEKTASLCW